MSYISVHIFIQIFTKIFKQTYICKYICTYKNIGGLYFLYGLTSSAIDVKRTHLVLAKSHINESKRIFSKIYGVNHPKTFPANMTLAGISQEMSE
jgi:hypothetical protein